MDLLCTNARGFHSTNAWPCSPHFLTMRERIAVNGLPISPDAFASLVAKHRPMLDELHKSEGVTHFEVSSQSVCFLLSQADYTLSSALA
jgi:folylpolyglutamate synthase/dihydropteroate synthase